MQMNKKENEKEGRLRVNAPCEIQINVNTWRTVFIHGLKKNLCYVSFSVTITRIIRYTDFVL